MKTLIACGLAALMLAMPTTASTSTTYEGFVAGYTQGARTGAAIEEATHLHPAGSSCSHAVTFEYQAVGGDVFFNPVLGPSGHTFIVEGGKDYINHFYLYVRDTAGNTLEEFIEDDGWEQGSIIGMQGAFPIMRATRTIEHCGDLELVVDAHRGAAPYTVTVESS